MSGETHYNLTIHHLNVAYIFQSIGATALKHGKIL